MNKPRSVGQDQSLMKAEMAPGPHRALIKSCALHWEYGAIWDVAMNFICIVRRLRFPLGLLLPQMDITVEYYPKGNREKCSENTKKTTKP